MSQSLRMELLDYGRFFAAISVVAYHYSFNGIKGGKITSIDVVSPIAESVFKYGYLGVDFFFIISGYVIFFLSLTRVLLTS